MTTQARKRNKQGRFRKQPVQWGPRIRSTGKVLGKAAGETARGVGQFARGFAEGIRPSMPTAHEMGKYAGAVLPSLKSTAQWLLADTRDLPIELQKAMGNYIYRYYPEVYIDSYRPHTPWWELLERVKAWNRDVYKEALTHCSEEVY